MLSAVANANAQMPGAPQGALLTATDCSQGEIVKDAEAFEGRAATSGGEYHPLVTAKLPKTGDAFTVWAHRKGGPIQLKANVNGGQVEKVWNWDAPTSYQWCSLGRYKRAEMPQGITIIRGAKQNAPDPRIDCIVLSSDAKAHPKGVVADGGKELPPEEPDSSLPATSAKVTIDWNKTVGKMTPSIWGFNDYEVLHPESASPAYQAFLTTLKPALIRVHEGSTSDNCTDSKTRNWNVERLRAGFASASGFGNAKIIFNVPSWPGWLEKSPDGTLTPKSEDEFVKLVGRLVHVMKDDLHRQVDYWELLNERDGEFEKIGKLDDLWRIHNRLYAEIKKQDPKAKVGGPAFTWAKPLWVEGFLKHCASNIDFVTWHNYASGDIYDSNEKIFSTADSMAYFATYIQSSVAKATPGKKVECFLDEYNVKWDWNPFERRHANNVGAVFQASVLGRMGKLGVDGVTVWHAKGNAYGLIGSDDKIRLTGRLYQIGANCLVGSMGESIVEGEKNLEIIAVKRSDGVRSVLLVNRADHTVVVSGAGKLGLAAITPSLVRIAVDGVSVLPYSKEMKSDTMQLPGYSVTLLSDDRQIAKLFQH